MAHVKISFVIPTWNRKKELVSLIDSIIKQDHEDFEIIVVDNGSSDGTVEYLNSMALRIRTVINKTNMGAAHAKNQGIVASRGDLVWFLDSDSEMHDSAVISRAVDIMDSNPEIGAIGGEMVVDSDGNFFSMIKRFRLNGETRNIIHKSRDVFMQQCDYVPTCNCLVRRKLLEKWGGFDPQYFILCEDDELGSAVREMGYKNIFDSRLTVIHHVSRSSRPGNFILGNRNRIRFVLINMPVSSLLLLPLSEISALFSPEKFRMVLKAKEYPHMSKHIGSGETLKTKQILWKASKTGMKYGLSLLQAYWHNLIHFRRIIEIRQKRPDFLSGVRQNPE
jgi:GT2 family glycosyltransferase